jgi:t-SNARE complex subunit (syntaxin)
MVNCPNCTILAAEISATRAIVERMEKAVLENAAEVAATRAVVEGMQKTLLGNGQPGRCAKHSVRIARLERWQSWLAGALAVIGILWVAAVTVFAAVVAGRIRP